MKETTINMSYACELAHELTRLEADRLGITDIDFVDIGNGEMSYTNEAQPVFDKYYDLITNVLGL